MSIGNSAKKRRDLTFEKPDEGRIGMPRLGDRIMRGVTDTGDGTGLLVFVLSSSRHG